MFFEMLKVIPAGLEPATRSLEGCCSIQLSYETIAVKSVAKIIIFIVLQIFFLKNNVFLILVKKIASNLSVRAYQNISFLLR